MKTLRIELPDRLYEEAEKKVKGGWFKDDQDLIIAALRYFLEHHRPELIEQFWREDVEWGLRGGQ